MVMLMIARLARGRWHGPRGFEMVVRDQEGGAYIPKRIGWTAVVGGFMFLGTQIWMFAETRANVFNEISNLKTAQAESRARGDVIRQQVDELRRGSDRITRVEEQIKVVSEMLREIRDDLRKAR